MPARLGADSYRQAPTQRPQSIDRVKQVGEALDPSAPRDRIRKVVRFFDHLVLIALAALVEGRPVPDAELRICLQGRHGGARSVLHRPCATAAGKSKRNRVLRRHGGGKELSVYKNSRRVKKERSWQHLLPGFI